MPSNIAYVCAISDYTLPTLEACLNLRPTQLILIASDGGHFQSQTQRLQHVLSGHLPHTAIHVLSRHTTGEGLDGDDIAANLQWLARHLVPLLQKYEEQGLHTVANLTGGTKAMTLALSACHHWHRLDYQPIGKKPLQSLSVQAMPSYQPQPSPVAQWHPASPLDIARLHNEQARATSPNPLRNHPSALPLAQRIWDAQQQQEPALQALFAGFERIWVHESEQHAQDSIQLEWAQFLPPSTPPIPDKSAIRQWVDAIGTLNHPLLHASDEVITLPGNRPKKHSRNLRNWISGDWLEQLAHHWLLQAGIPDEAIACNTTCAAEDDSGSQREADLLVHHQHTTSLIEIKAGIPPGKTPGELENQLSSLGSRFGKTRKALLLGPQLLLTLRQQKKAEDFWFRCQANSVTLLLQEQHLLDFVQGKSPWPRQNATSPAAFTPCQT